MCSQLPGCVCDAEDPREPPTQHEMLTVIMLKDVLDGIEHHFGKGGLELVTDFATMQNRTRESNRVMDELERLYGPLPDDVGGVAK